MKKFLKKLGITLLVLILIPTVLITGFLVIGNLTSGNSVNAIKGQSAALSDELTQLWKNTPSGIEGMSKYDLYRAGLSLATGADTDGDGLTDKDEIEVYGTDPLKASSSGDLYSDGYKVANDMDPSLRYDYQGDRSFAYNSCPEVHLNAQNPLDFNAVVKPLPSLAEISGLKVYCAYDVYNYGGRFSVDLTKVLRENGLTTADISIYVSNGATLSPYSFTEKQGLVTLKKAFSPNASYKVCVTEKNFAAFAAAVIGADSLAEELSSLTTPERQEITGDALVICSPLLTLFFNTDITVYNERLLSPDSTQLLRDKIQAYNDALFGTGCPYAYEEKSSIEITLLYNFLKSAASFLDITDISDSQLSWYHTLFLFYSYEERLGYFDQWDTDSGDQTTDSEHSETADPVTGFDPMTDVLPFGNFKTALSPNGSCAGISHLTAYLYNQKCYPSRYDGGSSAGIPWDLSIDEENLTLCEPGLGDYKSTTFLTDHSEDGQTLSIGLSRGEEEFLKMIASAYQEGNANAEFICYDILGGNFSTVSQDYAVIESAIAYLHSGKILDVYLGMADGTRHTVNLYGYQIDPANPDVVLFHVYDCNFPPNSITGLSLSDSGFTLRIEKWLNRSGDGWTFAYDYFPLADKRYGATSNPDICNNTLILILDEFGHLLND